MLLCFSVMQLLFDKKQTIKGFRSILLSKIHLRNVTLIDDERKKVKDNNNRLMILNLFLFLNILENLHPVDYYSNN